MRWARELYLENGVLCPPPNLRVYDNRGVKIYDFDVQKFPRINTTIVQVLREIHSLVSKEHKYSNLAKLGL